MEIPLEQFQKQRSERAYDFLLIPLKITEIYKGQIDKAPITLKYQAKGRSDAPEPDYVLSLDKKEAIFFLEYNDWPSWKGIYFTSHEPNSALVEFNRRSEATIKSEIKTQAGLISDLKLQNSEPRLHSDEVKELIREMFNSNSAARAYSQLAALGKDAAPAIISQMNDFRELPLQEFTLTLQPGVHATYKPKVVADVLAAILDQTTGECFGRIYNGGSERERQAAIWGWSLWLAKMSREKRNSSVSAPSPSISPSDVESFFRAITKGDVETVKDNLAKGIGINIKSSQGMTPLGVAAFQGNIRMLELLISKGADVNLRGFNQSTPLILASAKGHLEAVKYLISKNADFRVTDTGLTPMMMAAAGGHKDVVEYLYSKGDKVNARQSDGWTPLMHAAAANQIEVAKLLLLWGANRDLKTDDGKTASTIAEEERFSELLLVLKNFDGNKGGRK